jgi:hypothetical protein
MSWTPHNKITGTSLFKVGANSSVGGQRLPREINGGLEANARWLSEPPKLEAICHSVQDIVVGKSKANKW